MMFRGYGDGIIRRTPKQLIDSQRQCLSQVIIDNQNSKWIKCSDRLPEHRQKVIAYNTRKEIVSSAQYSDEALDTNVIKDNEWYNLEECEPVNGEVTHWMALPEPPKDNE
jgi:hypothetical protein